MNKVFIEVEAPESVWARGKCAVSDEGTLSYEAKFCKSGSAIKPTHLGPAVSMVVRDDAGKEVGRRSVTIGVKTNGDFYFQNYVEVSSEVEKVGLAKE